MVWFFVEEGGVLWDWEGFFSREVMKLRIESNTIRFTSLLFAGITLPFPLFLGFSLGPPPPPGFCLSSTIASYLFLISSSLLHTFLCRLIRGWRMIYRKKEGAACEFPGRNLDESNLVQWANLTRFHASLRVYALWKRSERQRIHVKNYPPNTSGDRDTSKAMVITLLIFKTKNLLLFADPFMFINNILNNLVI